MQVLIPGTLYLPWVSHDNKGGGVDVRASGKKQRYKIENETRVKELADNQTDKQTKQMVSMFLPSLLPSLSFPS